MCTQLDFWIWFWICAIFLQFSTKLCSICSICYEAKPYIQYLLLSYAINPLFALELCYIFRIFYDLSSISIICLETMPCIQYLPWSSARYPVFSPKQCSVLFAKNLKGLPDPFLNSKLFFSSTALQFWVYGTKLIFNSGATCCARDKQTNKPIYSKLKGWLKKRSLEFKKWSGRP